MANSRFLQIGGGLNLIYGRNYFHFKGYAALNEPDKNLNNFRTSAFGYGGGITYGYAFLPPFRLIPYVGLTFDNVEIEIEELPSGNSNIQTQISSQKISSKIAHFMKISTFRSGLRIKIFDS